MRRLLVSLLVLAVVVIGLDRIAAFVATRQLASKVQSAEGLSQRPGAAIRGFPFLTQVLSGRYDEVDLTARGIVRTGVRVDTVALRAQGVRVDLGQALRGQVQSVPVERGTATVLLTFDDLNALARPYTQGAVTVSSGGGSRLRLQGTLSLLGVSTAVTADAATVTVGGGRLRITPLPGALDQLPSQVRDRAAQLLTLSLPLPALPFGLHIASAAIIADGVTATAAGDSIVIPVGGARG